MLNKLLPVLGLGTIRSEVRRFHTSAFRFDRFGGSAMLLRNLVSDGDDGAVRGGFVEVIVEVLESAVRCLGIKEVDGEYEGNVEHGEHFNGRLALLACILGRGIAH